MGAARASLDPEKIPLKTEMGSITSHCSRKDPARAHLSTCVLERSAEIKPKKLNESVSFIIISSMH